MDESTELKPGVEKVEDAPNQPTQQAPADDPEQDFKATLEEVHKAVRDRDNYRTLALKYKSEDEIKADLTALETGETLTPKTEGQPPASETVDPEKARLARQNKELRLALQGKSVVPTAGAGASGGATQTQKAYFTSEQKTEMQKRWKNAGIAESKWPEMLKKAESLARTSSLPGTN